MLLCHDVDCVFHGVCCDDNTVIGLGISGVRSVFNPSLEAPHQRDLRNVYFTLKQYTHGHLHNGLHAGLLVAVDLVDTNIVLTVPRRCKFRHCNGRKDGSV